MHNCKLIKSIIRSGIAISLLSLGTNAFAAKWSDTYISYMYGPYYKFPGTRFDRTPSGNNYRKENVPINTLEFTHVSGYKYGTNFFSVRTLFCGKNNPEHGDYGQQGAMEIFTIYRHTLSLSAVTGKKLEKGFIKDYGIDAGFNLSAKNNAVNTSIFAQVLGPSVNFNVPGYWTVGLLAYHEYNNNRFNTPARQNFNTTWLLSSAWGINLPRGRFQGFLSITGPKGKDTAGVPTRTETLVEAYYMHDISKLFAQDKETFYAGLGGQYWAHKFGTYDHAPSYTVNDFIVSKTTVTPVVRLEAHF